jgi:hypothetical protein
MNECGVFGVPQCLKRKNFRRAEIHSPNLDRVSDPTIALLLLEALVVPP